MDELSLSDTNAFHSYVRNAWEESIYTIWDDKATDELFSNVTFQGHTAVAILP